MRSPTLLRIGSRSSPLALIQAEKVKNALLIGNPSLVNTAIEILPITTSGDKNLDASLYDRGGKGLFTKELEDALCSGQIDMAVHSMKDMTSALPQGLTIGAVLEREDPRDGLIGGDARALSELKSGAVVGTSSPRRAAQVLMQRGDIIITHFRGNVNTRLKKVEEGVVDATLLAMAGLKRLGIAYHATPIPVEVMLPAVAQGVIGVECRADDKTTLALLAAITHPQTELTMRCERTLLAALEGSCRTPLAGYATLNGEVITLQALIATPDGKPCHRVTHRGKQTEAEIIGKAAADELLSLGGKGFFDTHE